MQKPKLMGILNVTPDSFYDKGQYQDSDDAIRRGITMYQQGADIIDIGGESTRPGAAHTEENEELKRVIPVIKGLKEKVPVPLSIDTMKPRVAEEAIKAGANWINDVTGFAHPDMRALAASSGAKICIMHMLGSPRMMQRNPHYAEGIILSLLKYFEEQIEKLLQSGVKEEQITLDPGIGFGKTVDDNIKILHNIQAVKSLGFPVLLGISRKSFMGTILNKPAKSLLTATLAVNTLALAEYVDVIRVHDIAEHRDVIDIIHYLEKAKKEEQLSCTT